jgi:hypothetical protein
MRSLYSAAVLVCLLASLRLEAQDPVGAIEGQVSDGSKAAIAAHVTVRNLATGLQRETNAGQDGLFRIPLLPVGQYRVSVDAPHFASFVQEPVSVNISESVRLILALS